MAGEVSPAPPADGFSFVRKVLIVCAIGSLNAMALVLLWLLREVLILVFGGVLLAVFLTSIAEGLGQRLRMRKGTALLLIVLALLAVVAIGLWFLAPHVLKQMEQLSQELGTAFDQLRSRIDNTPWGQQLLGRMPPGREVISQIGKLLSEMPIVISSTFAAIGGLALLLFVGLYGSIQSRLFFAATLKIIPPRRRQRGREILNAMGDVLYWWLLGRFVSMLLIGFFSALGLYALDVPLALSLGLLAGLLTFIPNLGPIISLIPAVLVAFSGGVGKVFWVLGLYLLLQTLESYFITPMVQKQAIAMPPALILVVQVCGGIIFGALGLLLATPLTALAIVLVKMIYIEDLMGDTPA